jgi:endonuclease NucS-like protein
LETAVKKLVSGWLAEQQHWRSATYTESETLPGASMASMAIYEKPTRGLMREMVSNMPIATGQIVTKEAILNWFASRYPKIKESTLAAHLVRLSTNAPSRIHHRVKSGEDDVFFQLDGSRYRLYNPSTDPVPFLPGSPGPNAITPLTENVSDEEAEPGTAGFAYEADLRNFLSKNLDVLEAGLRLYEEEGIMGVEFPAGGRFIDILALDAKGGYVVIELKVSRGYDRVIGQLLRYMGWILKNHADTGQAVRGIIVAREISNDLILACSRLSDLELFEYEMAVSVRKITI